LNPFIQIRLNGTICESGEGAKKVQNRRYWGRGKGTTISRGRKRGKYLALGEAGARRVLQPGPRRIKGGIKDNWQRRISAGGPGGKKEGACVTRERIVGENEKTLKIAAGGVS